MSRPPLHVRLAGSRTGACLLFVVYTLIIAGWNEGQIAWWLALGSVGAAMRTLSAVGRVRRYKAWKAQWDEMGEPAPPRSEKRNLRAAFVTGALALAAIPALPLYQQANDHSRMVLTAIWGVACLYLIVLTVRGISRWKRSRLVRQGEVTNAPVKWLLGRASSSPSRSEAARKLPDYCARLLTPKMPQSTQSKALS